MEGLACAVWKKGGEERWRTLTRCQRSYAQQDEAPGQQAQGFERERGGHGLAQTKYTHHHTCTDFKLGTQGTPQGGFCTHGQMPAL